MEKIRLSISQTSIDIARNHQQNQMAPSRTCVIAIALQRKFPHEAQVISVGFKDATIDGAVYKLTSAGQKVIEKFDAKHEVKPFETTLTRIIR